jgi:hypothetical protein
MSLPDFLFTLISPYKMFRADDQRPTLPDMLSATTPQCLNALDDIMKTLERQLAFGTVTLLLTPSPDAVRLAGCVYNRFQPEGG